MKLMVLHLSDLHIVEGDDIIFERLSALASAVRGRELGVERGVLLISGDFTNTGNEEEFMWAAEFVDELVRAIESEFQIDVTVVAVPGNHDCDFSEPANVREVVLDQLDPAQVDDSIVSVTTRVQEGFFSVRDGFWAPDRVVSPLYWEYRIGGESDSVLFRCLNTAWCSRLQEKPGQMVFPMPYIDSTGRTDQVVISVFHHPYGWLEPDNARALREVIEPLSDIIVTGHEHVRTRRVQRSDQGAINEYVEGDVLQERGENAKSGFNLIMIDTEEKRQKLYHFQWLIDSYTPEREPEWENLQVSQVRSQRFYEVAGEFENFLNDLGVTLSHPSKARVTRRDVFVYPDLREMRYGSPDPAGRVLNSETLLAPENDQVRVLITGPEQAGKTTLAKEFFETYHSRGLVPVYVDASKTKISNPNQIQRIIEDAFGEQYEGDHIERYRQLSRHDRAVILDNYEQASIPGDEVDKLIMNLEDLSDKIVIFADEFGQQLNEIGDARRIMEEHSGFGQYSLQRLSHVRRDALVQKWLLLDPAMRGDKPALARAAYDLEKFMDTVIGRNLVPAYPVYVLAVLQGRESGSKVDVTASTHGYYYELFIRNALAVGGKDIKYDIKIYHLAYIAYAMFQQRSRELSRTELERLHIDYQQEYGVRVEFQRLLSEYIDAGLFATTEDLYWFKYDYAYFYFVARYLADNLSEETVKGEVENLTERTHEEVPANILLFLAHLSKDPFILNQMLLKAQALFQGTEPATLDKEVQQLEDSDEEFEIAYEETDPDETRRQLLAEKDRQLEERNADQTGLEKSAELVEYLQRLGAAFRTAQILGQILKNFPGSLRAPRKIELAEGAIGVGLRALGSVLELLKANRRDLAEELVELHRLDDPQADIRELRKRAMASVSGLTKLTSYGAIRRIATAVSAPVADVMETLDQIARQGDSPAVKLVHTAVKVEQMPAFPHRDIVRLAEEFENNLTAKAILKVVVVKHFHLFHVDFKIKQSTCAKLGIPYKRLRSADPKQKLLGRPKDED